MARRPRIFVRQFIPGWSGYVFALTSNPGRTWIEFRDDPLDAEDKRAIRAFWDAGGDENGAELYPDLPGAGTGSPGAWGPVVWSERDGGQS